jgi:protein SMG6
VVLIFVAHARLADLHHDFLMRIFDPLVPPSLHQLTVRYNIPSRLWQNGFHLLLERLRHSWMTGHPTALDLLTDFVHDGYKFYTDLLEDIALVGFRTAWIEALGDLARYRMAIARQIAAAEEAREKRRRVQGDQQTGKVKEMPDVPNGAEVEEQWDVEDTDTWRQTATDWYSMGITEKPGEGRLHHHLALLARDLPDGEGRALHHFTRSLAVTHEFPTARESILGLFDVSSQRRMERIRNGEKETAMDLFIRLHGMLFTRIEMDRFNETLGALMARLEAGDAVEQVEWMIMASVNVTGMMQYGLSDGVLRKGLAQEGADRRKAQTLPGGLDEIEPGENAGGGLVVEAEVDNGVKGSDPDTWPLGLTYACQLAFTLFGYTLRQPTIPQGARDILNPYITTFITFLATLSRQTGTSAIITPWIPWSDFLAFINTSVPPFEFDPRPEVKLVTGQPVPEDWLLRGAEWVGRRVYERGFWKVKPSSGRGGIAQPIRAVGERFGSEMDVLVANFEKGVDVGQGVVDPAEGEEIDGAVEVGKRRWRRVGWAAAVMSRGIPGLEVGGSSASIAEPLKTLVGNLERKRVADQEKGMATRHETSSIEDEQEDTHWNAEDDDDPELAVLRDRFKHLQSLVPAPADTSKPTNRAQTRPPPLRVIQGYTTLVFDTNVLLSSLTLLVRLIESGRWTIVIPLPVLTELDGLAREPAPLGIEAVKAISYLEANVRTRSMVLRIQTTKGSYLSDLRVRTEAAEIKDADKDRKTMDDRILDVARWQLEHFADRSLMLGGPGPGASSGVNGERATSKVVLVTFDRNLRLRARAAGVDAVDEREMAAILGK